MDFVALDVETANFDIGSICQIGIAKYRQGKLIDTFESLINPRCSFSQKKHRHTRYYSQYRQGCAQHI